MAPDCKLLTQVVAFYAEGTYSKSEIKQSDLPQETAVALKAWADGINISPVDDDGTSLDLYRIDFSHSGLPETFIADYSGDDPDQFRCIAVLQGGTVIGESIDVAD